MSSARGPAANSLADSFDGDDPANEDIFVCDECGCEFDIEDSVRVGERLLCPSCDDTCAECARGNGPHYTGPCEH